MGSDFGQYANQAQPATPEQMGSMGGLGGLAQLLRGNQMQSFFNKGGKVGE